MKSKSFPPAKTIQSWFSQLNRLKVFVVGDVMLDNYWYGSSDRISPEAPVPIVQITKKESRLGGAANVAVNCKAMGADVFLMSVCGADADAKTLIRLCESFNIHTSGIVQSKKRKTTTKTRIIARHQQTLRLDEEESSYLQTNDEHHFIDVCLRAIQIEAPDILIFEDYNKGLLTPLVIEKIIGHCKTVGVFTAVDPKFDLFFSYVGCDLFKPNLKEIQEALGTRIEINLKHLKQCHEALHERLKNEVSFITLSEHGVFVQREKEAFLIPAHPRSITDVSGAGDTVISVMSLIYFISRDISISASIANLAGGLVCEQPGVVSVNKKLLLAECLKQH